MTDSASDTETGSDSGSDSNANGVTGNNDSYTDFANGSEHFSLSMNGGSTTTGDTDTFTLTDTSNDSFNGNDSGHVGGPAVSTSALAVTAGAIKRDRSQFAAGSSSWANLDAK